MTNNKKIEEIKERLNKIRPFPWKSYIENRDHQSGDSFIMVKTKEGKEEDIYLTGATDDEQDFIANAPEDIAFLLQELDKRHNNET